MSTLTDLWILYNFLREAYRNRLYLLRMAKLLLRGAKVTSGGFSLLFGAMFEAAIPVGLWKFYQQTTIHTPSDLFSSVAASLFVGSTYAFIGLYLVGLGVVAIAPNSRFGKRFRNAWFSGKRKVQGGLSVRTFFRVTIMKLGG